MVYTPSVTSPLASILESGPSGTQQKITMSRPKHQLEVILSGSLKANALIRACGALRRLSQKQVPFQLQHNTVTGRTSKMLKGQEGNILLFVITCCSSDALVQWGTPGGFGQSSPSQIGMRPSMCHLPIHLHASLRHTDTEDTAFQGCSCWPACSLPRCLEQTHELAGYAGVNSWCPVLERFHDAPST